MRLLKFFLLVGLAMSLGGGARGQSINGIVAIVNDTIITNEDVQNDVANAFDLLERQYARNPALLQQKKREVLGKSLEELVERKLILEDFKKAGYNLPESIIEESIKERIRKQFGDHLKLRMTLQAQGKTYEGYKQQVRERIIVDAMRQRNLVADLIISPYKIEHYYQAHLEEFKLGDQVKLRMIFLDKAKHDPGLDKLAKEILLKVDQGAPFAEMASVYSDGSQAQEGGDWGWVEKKVLRPELAGVAFTLKAGQHSEVIEQAEGFYLMMVEEARVAHTKPLTEIREEIERNLEAEEHERRNKKWIERLKNKSFIRYFN